MQISKPRLIIFIAAAFVAGALFMIGMGLLVSGSGITSLGSDKISDSKIQILQGYIDKYYLNDYDENELVEGAYNGYVAGLDDPYSDYMSATEYDSWKASTTGNYSGVGITFSEDEKGRYVVLEVSTDSPAEKAGVKTGDYILKVDDKTYENIDIMAADIRGEKETTVTLQIYHDGKTKDVKMTRAEITQKSVSSKMLDNDMGYIKISSFIENTGDDFNSAFTKLKRKGAKSIILDLRDNGGGLVDQCVEVADTFLDKGVVCYVEDKNGNTETYDATDGKTDIPTVVLINENSASASEILAGALQDNGYKLIGKKSFGKGVIQTTMELNDGSALKLTIMQYLSPDKHVIQKKGIKPDYVVNDKEKTDEDEQLQKAESVLLTLGR